MSTLQEQTVKIELRLEPFPEEFTEKKGNENAKKFASAQSRSLILKNISQFTTNEKFQVLLQQELIEAPDNKEKENIQDYLKSLPAKRFNQLFEHYYQKTHDQFELLDQRDKLLKYYEKPYIEAIKKEKENNATKHAQQIIRTFENAYQARLALLQHNTQNHENGLVVLPFDEFFELTEQLITTSTKARRLKHYPFTNKNQKKVHDQINDVITEINNDNLTNDLKTLYNNPYLSNKKITAKDSTEDIEKKQSISLDRLRALKDITNISLPDPLHDAVNKTGNPHKDLHINNTCTRITTRLYLLEHHGPYDTQIIGALKKYITSNYQAITDNVNTLDITSTTIPDLRPEITNEELFSIATSHIPLEKLGYLTYTDLAKYDPDPRTYLIDTLAGLKNLPKDLTHYKRDLLADNENKDFVYLTAQLSNIVDRKQWQLDHRNPYRDEREFEANQHLDELAVDTLYELETHREIERDLSDPRSINAMTYEQIQDKLENKRQIEYRIEDALEIFEENNFEIRQSPRTSKLNTFFYTNPRNANISNLIVRSEVENLNNLLSDRYFPDPEKLVWIHGAQDYDKIHVHHTLDELYPNKEGLTFIHSGLSGSVTAADTWLLQNRFQHIVMRPDWTDPNKRKAAPFKNIEQIARGFFHKTLERHLQPEELVLFIDPDREKQNGLVVKANEFAEENGINVIQRFTKPIEISIDKDNPEILDEAMLSGISAEELDGIDYEY